MAPGGPPRTAGALRGGHDHGIPDAGVAQVQMQNRDVQSGGAAQPGRRLLAKETRV